MSRRYADLKHIENNTPITWENNYEFLYQLQCALLLALLEQGQLNHMQYRYAEDHLKKQRRERARQKQVGL